MDLEEERSAPGVPANRPERFPSAPDLVCFGPESRVLSVSSVSSRILIMDRGFGGGAWRVGTGPEKRLGT